MDRGLDPALARKVAEQFTAKDPLAAHARDELGLTDEAQRQCRPRRLRVGGRLFRRRRPADRDRVFAPQGDDDRGRIGRDPDLSLALGALGAWLGGAKPLWPALRVGFWGAMAMAVTAGIGALVGRAV